MGQIQNQLNQLLMTSLGAAYTISKTPYAEGRRAIAGVEEKAQALEKNYKLANSATMLGGGIQNLEGVAEEYEKTLEKYGTKGEKEQLYAGEASPFSTYEGYGYGPEERKGYWEVIAESHKGKEGKEWDEYVKRQTEALRAKRNQQTATKDRMRFLKGGKQ